MWLFSKIYKNAIQKICTCSGLVVLILLLNGCSDVNIHQLDKDIQDKLQMIAVPDISTREGQLYVRELRNLLHVGGKTHEIYKLTTNIYSTDSSAVSVADASSTLKKMTMQASFTLYDLESDKNLFSGYVVSDATLGTVTSLFGQGKAESHSRERLAILLAQRVVHQLQLYFLGQDQKIVSKP